MQHGRRHSHKHRHQRQHIRILLCYKHYANHPGVSHIGLGVTATNIAKYLQSNGINAQVFPVVKEINIEDYLRDHKDVTHVHVSALWVKTATFARWCALFPHVHFSVTCHSNAAFLQSEPEAITLIREAMNLEEMTVNFTLCGNNERFCSYIESAYGGDCTHIPNLYYVDQNRFRARRTWNGGPLRIGVFGAARTLKNFNTAVGAAIGIARMTSAQTEIWINVARRDSSDADVVLRAVRNSVRGLPQVELKELPWSPWPEFKRAIGTMNLNLCPSFTETFLNVAADSIAEGVPVVGSSAVEWMPNYMKADTDDVADIARVGVNLLRDDRAPHDAFVALRRRNEMAFLEWERFLLGGHHF